jgi:RNase H-like domain found in reverse transcriptase
VGWSHIESEYFNTYKVALQNATSLAHRNEELRLCVYTDASERYWSSVVTQVLHDDLFLPHAEQNHELLAFCLVPLLVHLSDGALSTKKGMPS